MRTPEPRQGAEDGGTSCGLQDGAGPPAAASLGPQATGHTYMGDSGVGPSTLHLKSTLTLGAQAVGTALDSYGSSR